MTAGVPRKPGQSRDDLIAINLPIIRDVADNAKKHCPDAFVIVISNPLDAMVYELKRRTGFAKERVVGMAGVLDSGALPALLGARGRRVGEGRARHGARRPRRRHGSGALGDAPSTAFLSTQLVCRWTPSRAIIERTRKGGGEIVGPHGNQRVLCAGVERDRDGRGLLARPEAAFALRGVFDGEYGYKDLYMGVPVVIGGKGVEKIVEVALSNDEKAMLAKSAASVQGDRRRREEGLRQSRGRGGVGARVRAGAEPSQSRSQSQSQRLYLNRDRSTAAPGFACHWPCTSGGRL